MAFLIQKRQSNKCINIKNDETSHLTWDLVWSLESASPASCKVPATFIDSIRQNNQPGKSKGSINDIQFPDPNCIVLPWSTHITQN